MTDELNQQEAVSDNTPEPIKDENGFPVADSKPEKPWGFIGLKEISNVEDIGAPFVRVFFTDGSDIRLHFHVYDIITTEEKTEAETNDLIFLCLAKEFMAKLVEYDLPSYQVDGIVSYMSNLAVNAHNEATKKLWGGKSSTQVTLQEIKNVLDSK